MARLGRSRPNRPILLRNPSFNQSTIVTGTIAVTLGAVTMVATGVGYDVPLAAANGVGNLVGVMAGRGPVAVGPNVVRVMDRRLHRARR